RNADCEIRWHLTADGGSGRDGVMRTGRLRLYKAGADHVMWRLSAEMTLQDFWLGRNLVQTP
ncbi:MAG: hypothetical protein WB685_18380, partial [Pseudolabrys sp.]